MNKPYSEEYQRSCFDVWYANDKPSAEKTQELVPEYENGKKPTLEALRRWIKEDWTFHADELDAQVELKADENLIFDKVEMLKRHREQARQVEEVALKFLLGNGFDSAASAVQALRWGAEEERKTAGFSDLLEKLETMSNNQVRDTIISLINRATENSQIVEGSEIPELESGDNEE